MHSWGFHHRVYHWRRSGMSAHLVRVVADGAAPISGNMPWELVFSLPLAHNTPFSVFSGLTLCLTRDTLFSAPIASLGDWTFDERGC
ncbi:inner membrane protein [Klebsiella quasipneumoniae]|nr:inner membrane protein [Klebsiella quasipneumoniae]